MRTLLIGVLLAVLSFEATASAQAERPFSFADEPKISFNLPVDTRARFQLDITGPSDTAVNRYRLPSQLPAYRQHDSCVLYREWAMVTPFQDCSHRSLRRSRPAIKFIYVF